MILLIKHFLLYIFAKATDCLWLLLYCRIGIEWIWDSYFFSALFLKVICVWRLDSYQMETARAISHTLTVPLVMWHKTSPKISQEWQEAWRTELFRAVADRCEHHTGEQKLKKFTLPFVSFLCNFRESHTNYIPFPWWHVCFWCSGLSPWLHV